MNTRSLLSLLYAGIFGILFILGLTLSYALKVDGHAPQRGVPGGDGPAVSAVESVPPAVKLGRAVWSANNCASCHAGNMKDDLTGPALAGVTARWAVYPREDLYAWIRNSQVLVSAGHPRAMEVWTENKKRIMTNYPNLTDEEIEGLLAYIESK